MNENDPGDFSPGSFIIHEAFTWQKGLSILTALGGLALLAGGGFTGNMLGVLTALGSAVCYAYFMLSNDLSPMKDLHPIVRSILFHYHITVVAVIGCALILCSLTFTALEDMKKQKADPDQLLR